MIKTGRPVELRFAFMHPQYGIVPLSDERGAYLPRGLRVLRKRFLLRGVVVEAAAAVVRGLDPVDGRPSGRGRGNGARR